MDGKHVRLEILETALMNDRVALVIALLNWISESPSQKNTSATPGYLSFGMSCKCFLVPSMSIADIPQYLQSAL